MNTAKTILVVDDDPDYRFSVRLYLEGAGYNVVEADNVEQAHAALDQGVPNLALVDLMMEEMDAGFSLCYYMKKRFPALPIIMISGVAGETNLEFDASTDEERSWVKADALLNKPIRFDQLKRELDRLLG
jgi:two-component system, OmpR family, response regulator